MQQRNPYLIGKAFKNYLVASVLTVAATQVANIVDAAIVGNLIGPEALAAVNLNKPVLQTIFAVSCLYIASSTILTGIAIGKGDNAKANKLFSFSVSTSLILGAVFTIGGLIAFNSLSHLLCHSENLRAMTNEFLFVTILSAIPQLLMYTLNQFVTVDGSPKLITRAVIVGNIFNIVFDIIFIKYCGWGIAGAAWATFLMYIICILAVLSHFRKKNTLRLCKIKRSDIEFNQILSLGLPLFFSTVLMSVQMIGNNYVASTYLGDGGLIALAVCMQLLAFSMIIHMGTIRTIQPIGSIIKGLEDDRGMYFLVQKANTFQFICLVIYVAAIIVFPTQIAKFLGVTDEFSLPIILKALPPFTLQIITHAMLYNLMPVYQLYNHKNLAFFLSVGQTLLPLVGFWILKGGWIGFFLGQVVVAIVILIGSIIVRRNNKSLIPILLIPKTQDKELYDVTIETTIDNLNKCTHEILSFLQTQGLDKENAYRYVLCVEELLKNIIDHGHAKYVDIRATKSIISIHDDGMPFNPMEYTKEDNGFGLKIVHGIGIDMKYDYRFNQNMVTINIENKTV